MRKSFKVAPGVRIRASPRGISAGIGPRAARVHVGTRGVGVSSGVGPLSAYSDLGGGGRGSSGGARRASSGGATKASIAAREREAKAAAREEDINRVAALEKALISVHCVSFPEAKRITLPPPNEVDPQPIETERAAAAGIPQLVAATGGGEVPPVAADPEPVDRYELMREHRKRARGGVPFWRIRDQIAAAREADAEAETAAEAEAKRRLEEQRHEQEHLDEMWGQLQATRSRVAKEVVRAVDTERKRRDAERAAEQTVLDDEWQKLTANDPSVTLSVLEEAFADNEMPAAAIDCDGDRTTVVMQFVPPETIVPERKPARTPTGKRTLKKRTKTEINALYLEALGSNVLATVKETFAVAPGTEVVQLLVVRRETDRRHAGELAAIYVGEFDRASYAGASEARRTGRAGVGRRVDSQSRRENRSRGPDRPSGRGGSRIGSGRGRERPPQLGAPRQTVDGLKGRRPSGRSN
jgi:Protein of unknown function (DUF4236)